MVVAGTVVAGDSMAGFRVMAVSLRRVDSRTRVDSLRRAGSRMQVGSRVRVVMGVGIVLNMVVGLERMRRSMGGGLWVVERV
jgi:uncharacterized membrane protein